MTIAVQTNDQYAFYRSLYRIAGASALLQLATILGLVVVMAVAGGAPSTAAEHFALYAANPVLAFLADDGLTVLLLSLYLGLVPGLYVALRPHSPTLALFGSLAAILVVAGIISTHTGFSMHYLSKLYTAAATEAERTQILTAGTTLISSDIWNSTTGFAGGILSQGGGVLLCIAMLRTPGFTRATAIAGLIGNSLDLVQHVLHPALPKIAGIIAAVMGIFYLAWYPLMGRDLLRLARTPGAG